MSWLMSKVATVFRTGVYTFSTAAALGLMALYVKQDNLLYHPSIGEMSLSPGDNPHGYRSPADMGIPFENLDIVCADGVHIHSWLLLHPDSLSAHRPTILFFHGNAGNIGYRLPNAQRMYQLGWNVLQVEYRGFGDSQNADQSSGRYNKDAVPSEPGLKMDAEASLQAMLNHAQIDNSKLFLFGRSLGGAVAFHLAEHCRKTGVPLAGLIVENTFTSIAGMVDVLMPLVAPLKGLILRIGWDSSQIVGGISTPVLYMAGGRDELVPHAHMKELHALSSKASLKSELHIVPSGTHNDTWMRGGEEYWRVFARFMQECAALEGAGAGEAVAVGVPMDGDTTGGGSADGAAIPIMKTFFFDSKKNE